MATYAQVVDQIISELPRSDTSITAVVQAEILRSIEHYSTSRFWFNEASQTITTSPSLANYAWPADMLEADALVVTISGQKYPVDQVSYAVMAECDPGNSFGYPHDYAFWNQYIRLYPIPNATYTMILDYQKRLTTLSASTDSNSWTTDALDLILARTEKVLAMRRYKDFEAAQAYDRMETEALNRLTSQTEKLIGSGRIKPD